jgi:ribosomal protein S12 methylthiotransferase
VKELILIAQDLTHYGLDIYKKRNLAELLEGLAAVEGYRMDPLALCFSYWFPDGCFRTNEA